MEVLTFEFALNLRFVQLPMENLLAQSRCKSILIGGPTKRKLNSSLKLALISINQYLRLDRINTNVFEEYGCGSEESSQRESLF